MSLLPTSPGHPHTYFSPGRHTYIHTPLLSSAKHTHTLLDPDIPFKPNQTATYFGGKNVFFYLIVPHRKFRLPYLVASGHQVCSQRLEMCKPVAWPSLVTMAQSACKIWWFGSNKASGLIQAHSALCLSELWKGESVVYLLQGKTHTPSITFQHLPPNSARFHYATEGALFISAQLFTNAVSALRKVWVLI